MTAPPTHTFEREDITPAAETFAIQFDAAEFVHFLEDADLSSAQKIEYVRMIWDIVLQFVDLGFGLHPIQQACGQFDEAQILCGEESADALHSLDPKIADTLKAMGAPRGTSRIPHMQGGDTP